MRLQLGLCTFGRRDSPADRFNTASRADFAMRGFAISYLPGARRVSEAAEEIERNRMPQP